MNTDINELKESLKYALKKVAVPLSYIDFTRDNYNKLFPYSRIQSPIETIKLGEHQFEKLDAKNRQYILQAVHDTLKTPDIIIDKERESVFGNGDIENTHIYAKSYIINNKTKAVQSVMVSIENENVSISTHERGINNIVNKIKNPDQLLYTAEPVRNLIERMVENQSVTVNPTKGIEYVNPPNTNISHSQTLSSNENKINNKEKTMENEKQTYNNTEKIVNFNAIRIHNIDDIFDDYGNIKWSLYPKTRYHDKAHLNDTIYGIKIIAAQIPTSSVPPEIDERDENGHRFYIFPRDFTKNGKDYPDAIKNMGYNNIDEWESELAYRLSDKHKITNIPYLESLEKRQLVELIDPNIFRMALIAKIQKPLTANNSYTNIANFPNQFYNFLTTDVLYNNQKTPNMTAGMKYDKAKNAPTMFWQNINGISIKQALDNLTHKTGGLINYYESLTKPETILNYPIEYAPEAYERIFGTKEALKINPYLENKLKKEEPKELSKTFINFITSIKKLHTTDPTSLFTKSQEALKQMPQKEKDKFNAICKEHGIDTQDKLVNFLAKISTTDFDVRKTKKPTQTKDKSKDNDRSR